MTAVADQPLEQAVATSAVVRVAALSKQIDNRLILDSIDLTIRQGEYVALLGANGAGKSTLLRVLATLVPPSSGVLELFGEKASQTSMHLRARIGLIGHQPMLYGELSARENLELFARLYRVPSPASRVDEMLRQVGLLDRSADCVKSFSRGMTQRLAIARALLHDPQLILADEPFAGLDEGSCRVVEQMLESLNGEGRTIVLVNHAIARTLEIARRVVVLREGYVLVDADASKVRAERIIEEISR